MAKIKWALGAFVIITLAATSLFPASAQADKVLYVGGTQSLTGPFAEDSAAVLAAIEDYVKYVNETKNLAPWRKERFTTRSRVLPARGCGRSGFIPTAAISWAPMRAVACGT